MRFYAYLKSRVKCDLYHFNTVMHALANKGMDVKQVYLDLKYLNRTPDRKTFMWLFRSICNQHHNFHSLQKQLVIQVKISLHC